MPDRPRVTIVVKPAKAFKVELFLFDPLSLRTARTGMTAGPRQTDIDKKIVQLKEQLEKSGSQVSVKEM